MEKKQNGFSRHSTKEERSLADLRSYFDEQARGVMAERPPSSDFLALNDELFQLYQRRDASGSSRSSEEAWLFEVASLRSHVERTILVHRYQQLFN